MIILGIDPGLQKVGWGIIETQLKNDDSHGMNQPLFQHITSGLIKTNTKDSLNQRIWFIFQEINSLLNKYKVASIAIENTYVNENAQSSLKLSHARAAIILASMTHGINPAEYQAKTIKKTITGNGNATKEQVVYMLKHSLNNLPEEMESLDVSDALAIAICHGFQEISYH